MARAPPMRLQHKMCTSPQFFIHTQILDIATRGLLSHGVSLSIARTCFYCIKELIFSLGISRVEASMLTRCHFHCAGLAAACAAKETPASMGCDLCPSLHAAIACASPLQQVWRNQTVTRGPKMGPVSGNKRRMQSDCSRQGAYCRQ